MFCCKIVDINKYFSGCNAPVYCLILNNKIMKSKSTFVVLTAMLLGLSNYSMAQDPTYFEDYKTMIFIRRMLRLR